MTEPSTAPTKLVNLTPHVIHIVDTDGNVVRTYPPSGVVARAKSAIQKNVAPLDGVPCVTAQDFTSVDLDLNDDRIAGATAILVSMPVGTLLCKTRISVGVYGPDTGPGSVARDLDGNIKGVRRLVRYN